MTVSVFNNKDHIWPDCFVCNDEGLVIWDDDQSRWRSASFDPRQKPQPCPECGVQLHPSSNKGE